MIRNIIWDVDGTLFDTYPAIAGAFQQALSDLGIATPLDMIMVAAKKSLGYCVLFFADKYSLKKEDIGEGFIQYYEKVLPRDQTPFPGVIKICQYIESNQGKNVIVSHRGRKGVEELLNAHQMTRYFSGWVTHDDDFPKKPNPAAFTACMEKHCLNKNETMAVGDRDIDIIAGKSAGLITCLFNGEVGESVPDLCISTYAELYKYLLEN